MTIDFQKIGKFNNFQKIDIYFNRVLNSCLTIIKESYFEWINEANVLQVQYVVIGGPYYHSRRVERARIETKLVTR